MTRFQNRTRSWLARTCIAASIFAALAFESIAAAAGPVDKVVRVEIREAADWTSMADLGAEAWDCRPRARGPVDFRITSDKLAALDESGLRYRVLIEDLLAQATAEAARIEASRLEGGGGGGGATWFDEYKDYPAISAYVDDLVAAHPQVASRLSLGQSLQGRDIFAIRIAAPGAPADRPAVFLHSLQHCREWVTGMTTMFIADRLVRGHATDPEVAALLSTVQFIIVPVVNPDGYVYTWASPQQRFWRKNRRPNPNGTTGVDLNRNWGFGWGGQGSSGNQGSETYRGPSAFSEPETQALRDFITANPHIKAHVDIHSYSQLVLSAWGYTADPAPDALLFDDLNSLMVGAFAGVHGTAYTGGPTFSTIYPASGVSSDWSYGAHGILGWGFELRDRGQSGFALPADQIIPTAQETFAAIAALADAVGRPIRFTFPDGVPSIVTADQAKLIRVVVSPMAAGVAPGSPTLISRIGRIGSFIRTPLMHVAGTEYAATLPAAPCGAQLEFFFDAMTTGGETVIAGAEAGPGNASGAFIAPTAPAESQTPCDPCPADFSRDGNVDPDDLGDFINCYFELPPCDFADHNADGNVDPDDLGDFINAFFAGC
ncbi:MAG: M14 family zinc carboxypeptidase [Phycisphaerales bacterium]